MSSKVNKNEHKMFICRKCLHAFCKQETLNEHIPLCGLHKARAAVLPEEGKNMLYFKNHDRKVPIPYIIYADTETNQKPFETVQRNKEETSYTEKVKEHVMNSFKYVVINIVSFK